MTTDQQRLQGYVDSWEAAVRDVVALLRGLGDDDWSRPTDLPGWDVRAVACHLAHLESELAGVKQRRVELTEAEHLTAPTSRYTELGIIARADCTPAEIVDELEECATRRHRQLVADPPTDGRGEPPRTPGKIGWSWETLLANRPVDVWMHEQDIRRAVARPGGLGSTGAAHTVGVFVSGFPYVVGKRVAPPVGTTVVLDVVGPTPAQVAVRVEPSGRAVPTEDRPEDPDVVLRMSTEAFIVLAGGRRPASEVEVEVSGDEDLAARVLAAMAVTP